MAVAQNVLEDLVELLTCAVCLDQLDDPRQLPCQHSFCNRCIHDWRTRPGVSQSTDSSGIVCPVCRKHTAIRDLPADFRAKELISMKEKLKGNGTGTWKCSVCGITHADSVHVCVDCGKAYCPKCRTQHWHTFPGHGHCSTEAAELDRLWCRDHEDFVRRFCVDCEKGICEKCLHMTNHQKHRTRNFTQADIIKAKPAKNEGSFSQRTTGEVRSVGLSMQAPDRPTGLVRYERGRERGDRGRGQPSYREPGERLRDDTVPNTDPGEMGRFQSNTGKRGKGTKGDHRRRSKSQHHTSDLQESQQGFVHQGPPRASSQCRGNSQGRHRHQPSDETLSRLLCTVLRHKAEQFGLEVLDGGFVMLDELLRHSQFRGYSQDDVHSAVQSSERRRLQLERTRGNRWKIRATEGHTMSSVSVDMERIKLSHVSRYPIVIHGTFLNVLPQIQRMGLSRMKRQYIHFDQHEPSKDGPSGRIRRSCEVLIYVNLRRALEDGVEFFVSSNDVILSPGNDDGYLETRYFSKIVNRKTRKEIRIGRA